MIFISKIKSSSETEFLQAKEELYQKLLPFSDGQLALIIDQLPFKNGHTGTYIKKK